MKKVLLVIMFLLLFPNVVFAKDTCKDNDIVIKSITKKELNGFIEEKTQPSMNNNKIDLGLEMFNVGDSITYNITIKNDSTNDYYFTKDSFNLNTDYLEYTVLNDSEVIKRNEEKIIQLKITYKNKIPNDSYDENNMMTITLADTPVGNPDTKATLFAFVLIIQIFLALILAIIQKRRYRKLRMIMALLISCIIPISTHALCTVNLEINSNIVINNKEAIFLPGEEVNIKMKNLAGDDTTSGTYTTNTSITLIKYSETEPISSNKEEKNIVSTPDSPYPIYMWYEEGTIYWWSEDKTPKLNIDAKRMFYYLTKLSDIASFSRFDTSDTQDMSYMFYGSSSIEDINSIKDWDTSKVTTLAYTFQGMAALTSIEALQNWNTSSVTNLSATFSTTSIESLNGLENWDTSNVTDMTQTFNVNPNLTSLKPLQNWNVSNVKKLNQTFANTALPDLTGLENWNTSSVTDLWSTFNNISTLKSVEALRNWNTSNVTRMLGTFSTGDLINLNGLENWDVSNVTTFSATFGGNRNMTDASAINDWNIQRTAYFSQMFRFTPVHPEFTKVPGTWSNGDFTPTN